MKVLILGANGKVGSYLASELIVRGHTVVAGIHRNKDNVPATAMIKQIDIKDAATIRDALKGVDAVVCALSSWGSPNKNVLSTAMQTVIPAMEKSGVKRIISISGDVARLPGENPGILIKLFHFLAFGTVRKIVEDSEDHLRQLHQSKLDWTAIRPTTMTSSTNTAYAFQDTHPVSPLIPRAAVVASIIDLLEHPSHIGEAPFIASRDS